MSKREEKESSLGVGDVIKKVVSIGVGAAFMTEDAVRGLLNDLPLPKDIISGLVQNAKGAKEDFTKAIREELRGHLSRLDMAKLVDEIVQRYDFEITAQVRFKKKENAAPDTENDA